MSQLGPYDLVTQIGDVVPIPSHLPFRGLLGQTIPFYMSAYQLGVLTTPTMVTFSVTDQIGNVITGTVMLNSTGNFESDIPFPLSGTPGVWRSRWTTSGQAYEGATTVVDFYMDAPLTLPFPEGECAPPPAPTPPTPGESKYVLIDGPATIFGMPDTVYVCDVTSGSVVINVTTIANGQTIGAIAAAGDFGANSVTLNASGAQRFARPAPYNNSPPIASYIIGGSSSSSGGGSLDAGTSLNWINGGITNVLTLA